MIITNERLLDEFRSAGRCELCGKACRTVPHHVRPKGRGFQLDIRINLIAVGATSFDCLCHENAQRYRISKEYVQRRVSWREACFWWEIEEVIWLLDRVRQDVRPEAFAAEVRELTAGAQALAWRTVRECRGLEHLLEAES